MKSSHSHRKSGQRSTSHGAHDDAPRRKGGDKSNSRHSGRGGRKQSNRIFLYGMHTVRAALVNPARQKFRLLATENSAERINVDPEIYAPLVAEIVEPAMLAKLVGGEAVHQGIVLEAAPLAAADLDTMQQGQLLLVLDQITDPHNVGAILRTAVAMNVGAVITTSRHSAQETGVLAKSASGAVDMIDHIQVGNLANAISRLSDQGYFCIGLDSEGPDALEETFAQAPNNGSHIALVLGAEGQGLRKKTRETCNALARLDMPGVIKSLNVSNAAAISLYAARNYLDK